MDLDNCPVEDISRGNWGVTRSLHWRDVRVSCPLSTVSVSRNWSVAVDCKLSTAPRVCCALVLELKTTFKKFFYDLHFMLRYMQPSVYTLFYWPSPWHYLDTGQYLIPSFVYKQTRGIIGSCVLKASEVECGLILLINTPIDTLSTLYLHLINNRSNTAKCQPTQSIEN